MSAKKVGLFEPKSRVCFSGAMKRNYGYPGGLDVFVKSGRSLMMSPLFQNLLTFLSW